MRKFFRELTVIEITFFVHLWLFAVQRLNSKQAINTLFMIAWNLPVLLSTSPSEGQYSIKRRPRNNTVHSPKNSPVDCDYSFASTHRCGRRITDCVEPITAQIKGWFTSHLFCHLPHRMTFIGQKAGQLHNEVAGRLPYNGCHTLYYQSMFTRTLLSVNFR